MPCNNTGYTDPDSTKGWGIVDFVRLVAPRFLSAPALPCGCAVLRVCRGAVRASLTSGQAAA